MNSQNGMTNIKLGQVFRFGIFIKANKKTLGHSKVRYNGYPVPLIDRYCQTF